MSRAHHYKTNPPPRVIENPTKVRKCDLGKTLCSSRDRNSGLRGRSCHGNVVGVKSTALPNFAELVNTASDNKGRCLVEIQARDKMLVCSNRLGAPSVLEVPHSECLVIRAAHDHFTGGVEYRLSHPIVMPDQRDDTASSTDIVHFDSLVT